MDYSVNRKKADSASTSLLSPYLHFGELSVRKVFHQVRMKRLMWSNDDNHAGEESCTLFLCSIGLREYSRYLTFNHPYSHEKPLLSHLRFFPWVVNEVYIIKVLVIYLYLAQVLLLLTFLLLQEETYNSLYQEETYYCPLQDQEETYNSLFFSYHRTRWTGPLFS
jgi:hypothetical protein